jgi:hypothetical protein
VTFLPLLIQDFKLRSMVHFSASTEVKLVLWQELREIQET